MTRRLRDAKNDTCVAIKQTPTKTIVQIVLALPLTYDTVITHLVTLTGKGDITCNTDDLTVWIGSNNETSNGSAGKYQRCVNMASDNMDNLQVCQFRCDCPAPPCDVVMFLLHKVSSQVEICEIGFM